METLFTGNRKRIMVFTILVLLVAAYSSFITADIFTGDSDNIYSRICKYCSILLCLVLTLIIGEDCHDKKDRVLLQGALLLHAAGDLCVGILGKFQVALIFFFFMQIVYITRHSRGFTWNRKEVVSMISIFTPVGIIFVFITPALWKAGIFFPVLIYTLTLTTSIWMGIGTIWRTFYPRTIDIMIAIAMVSFFFCDLNVGLYNSLGQSGHSLFVKSIGLSTDIARGELVTGGGTATIRDITLMIPFTLRSVIGILVWIFYLPTVTLLAMSGYRVAFIRSILPLVPDLPEPGQNIS
jgi:hypothetical protein